MSYQVLARKWRPNRFGELVGQEHVVTAISNALDNNRLHHAYLFTGTRGVGKTTIARIFSKSLNCEQGLSAHPCGQCSTCKEIENGNFIDLLEIDAASRTKVEDTRELLDNVQYKPSRGRYKVYLIDEVHMLSKHSFNALLKTLEEPPPHVKFLLATTDPQKLPVTILSRCLQFNLKALSRTQISQQLEHVLGQESIPFDKESLSQLARAAQGSMRDALSLTDQAIAQGNGAISVQIVTDMLGLMDKNQVLKLIHGVIQKDSAATLQQVELMAQQAPDYGLVLAEMMSLLHQIALTQFVPDACKLETIAARAIFQLAKTVPAEQIQLLYQIALTGKKDLPHAADARTGLEMTLLRMLAFCPGNLKLDALDIAAKTPKVEGAVAPQANQAASIAPEVTIDSYGAKHQQIAPELASQPESQPQSQPQSLAPQVTQPTATEAEEADLFAQQQDIMAQAEGFGHQVVDYDQYQTVAMDEQPTEAVLNDVPQRAFENTEVATDEQHQQNTHQTTTADLIALRNKIHQSKSEEGEGTDPVKKLESVTPPNLAFARNLSQDVDNAPVAHRAEVPSQTSPLGSEPIPVKPNGNNAPPWSVDSPLPDIPANAGPSPFSAESEPQEAVAFDSSAHLDKENVGDVTLDIAAFLPNKQKVTKALQVDNWSRLIEEMQVTALTKQLALHSAFHHQGNTVKLTLLQSKAHLISETAQQQLQQALCLALNQSIELEIELGQPINTPYALQGKVNQVRQEYAREVVKNDPGIQLLQQNFAAKVDQQSIQAR
ncbi:DNA polymerase III subunit gamma/tau [uncultured Paraglaciecola sp.]|uniref:DNA polymerase III subunit gamma/tau n=1 Tax=uncultured Paraglaciecola sp. TaxID=1765024 RepID=UPI0026125D66|nr:DNA polymerase III subunit gamma/tau [uncultured Paraglaciecola sp.]